MGRWWVLYTPLVRAFAFTAFTTNFNGLLNDIRFLSQECHNWTDPSKFYRISSYANWIVEAACALTQDDDLELCPDLVCPPDDRVLGYPRAEVPDASARIKIFRRFQPSRGVVQSPPAGTLFNTSTKVLVLGVDAPDRVALCVWTLTFPDIEYLGTAYEEIPSGTYARDAFFFSDMWFEGLAVRMTVRLDHVLYGNATIEVKAGHNESVVVSSGDTEEVEFWFQTPFDPWQYDITLIVTDLEKQNIVDVSLYGQTTHWYI